MFASLRDRFLALPDYVQVWPGHGAGSACGKALGAVPELDGRLRTALLLVGPLRGKERRGGLRGGLLEGQPDVPAYFGRMKRQNKMGPALLGKRSEVTRYGPSEVGEKLRDGDILFLDTRSTKPRECGIFPELCTYRRTRASPRGRHG